MVVSNVNDVKRKIMDSQALKFGMDRILSEDTSSTVKRLEAPCATAPPCAGCISSLYRCCRASATVVNANAYRGGIHAPQPLRPYTNGEANLGGQQSNANAGGSKRKRSWSRAVFSNLQRKGLEKRFQLQKYITKPDRRQLAATLGLTDAQVKVWFQNRRMKWRHTKESSRQSQAMNDSGENILVTADSTQTQNTDSECESDIDRRRTRTCPHDSSDLALLDRGPSAAVGSTEENLPELSQSAPSAQHKAPVVGADRKET